MSSYAKCYLVHFLIFGMLTVITFMLDFVKAAEGCEEGATPEGTATLLLMLMLA